MGLLDRLKSLLRPATFAPPPERRLDAASEEALSASVATLVHGARGWIALAEARSLFSTAQPQYAFGDDDRAGRARLDAFAARNRCTVDIMPDGRVYLTRM